jgi:hypothetical protein
MPRKGVVRAGALPEAQEVVDALRDAYQEQPGAMLIGGVTLNPLEVIAIDGQTGQYYRVPVTVDQASGTYQFGSPIPAGGAVSPNAYPSPPGAVYPGVPGGTPSLPAPTFSHAASRGVSPRDQARIQAAVVRGALPAHRAAFWEAKAARGEDVSVVDQLVAVLPLTATDKVAAAASREDADYERMFGPQAPQNDDGGQEYSALFGTVAQGQRASDAVQAAARREVEALTDDQLFERMFGPGESRTAAPGAGPGSERPVQDPLAARAAGRAGKNARREPPGTWATPSRPYPPRP